MFITTPPACSALTASTVCWPTRASSAAASRAAVFGRLLALDTASTVLTSQAESERSPAECAGCGESRGCIADNSAILDHADQWSVSGESLPKTRQRLRFFYGLYARLSLKLARLSIGFLYSLRLTLNQLVNRPQSVQHNATVRDPSRRQVAAGRSRAVGNPSAFGYSLPEAVASCRDVSQSVSMLPQLQHVASANVPSYYRCG